jgi:hypothetical protein
MAKSRVGFCQFLSGRVSPEPKGAKKVSADKNRDISQALVGWFQRILRMSGYRQASQSSADRPRRHRMHPGIYASFIAVALLAPFAGYGQEGPSAMVADGKPWTSVQDGRSVTITFFPDGTARIKLGLMRRAATWQPTTDGFCLKGLPDGGRCLRLEKTSNGYIGYEGDVAVMTLSRD